MECCDYWLHTWTTDQETAGNQSKICSLFVSFVSFISLLYIAGILHIYIYITIKNTILHEGYKDLCPGISYKALTDNNDWDNQGFCLLPAWFFCMYMMYMYCKTTIANKLKQNSASGGRQWSSLTGRGLCKHKFYLTDFPIRVDSTPQYCIGHWYI